MTEYASFDDLVSEDVTLHAEDFVTTDGTKVRLRPCSRAEQLWVSAESSDPADMEVRMLSTAMVAPAMTIEQAARWQQSGKAATVAEVSRRIQELSGFSEGADKSSV
ncbi:MAG: hypothetical protein JXA67_20350 [Micromonosporaceae bacterium]|nr:hypothetical protein [Micromonosporaceae bacterium]